MKYNYRNQCSYFKGSYSLILLALWATRGTNTKIPVFGLVTSVVQPLRLIVLVSSCFWRISLLIDLILCAFALCFLFPVLAFAWQVGYKQFLCYFLGC